MHEIVHSEHCNIHIVLSISLRDVNRSDTVGNLQIQQQIVIILLGFGLGTNSVKCVR